MRLAEGFVVGGTYRVVRLLAAGSKFRVYEADTEASGPGSVVVKVARHDDVRSLAGLEAGRARVHTEWEIQKKLHEEATSAAPLPIELVRMYPGDPAVRKVALLDKALVREEPYLISEMADGLPLTHLLIGDAIDEERALLIALRVVLLIRSARQLSVELRDFAPSNFIVDSAGENVTLVGFGGDEQPEDWHDYSEAEEGQSLWKASSVSLPLGFGRLLVGLLAGMAAPEWGNTDADLPRWERLLTSRRVPPEFAPLVLGSLGYFSRFEGTIDAVENRIRGLVGSPHPTVHKHPARARDAPYLIANGERLGERFEVTKPLGQGGRGFVYRAIDRTSKVEILIKANKYIYDSGSGFATELATRRLELEHEFDVLKRFSSQTGMLPQPVALVRGLGRGAWFDLAPDLARGEPYVVMEYIKGIPLVDLLAKPFEGYAGATDPKNRLPARFVCRLVAQIADLLSRFHDQGFLYQDLKPENVLYDPRAENVYMVDFAGACPRLASGQLDKEHVSFGVQTHGFAPPEFADLWEDCDDRFDIYSLGATAYHLATGVNPERVAMESGEEYPSLSLSLLNTIEPPLATLIAGCLAPLPDRLRSAEAVRDLAESARLQLSRSRPLDVREPELGYTEEGVEIRWTVPPDPRITAMRIRRYGESDEETTTIYSGPAVEQVIDGEPAADDQFYLIETAYERAGRIKHSRGRVVRSEANPAPVRFEVEPYFEGNRLRVVIAPQATGAAIRWSTESPPVDLSEGQELECDSEATFHSIAQGTTVHYAAFALYDDLVSVPRFGTATAVGPVEDVGPIEVVQTSDGVLVRWEKPSSNVLVHAVRGSESGRVPVPSNATEIVDLTPGPGERLAYVVQLTRDGVVSDPIAEVQIHRWPDPPPVVVEGAAGKVRLLAPSPLHQRFSGLRVSARDGDETLVTQEIDRDDFPFSIDVPGDTPLELRIEALVEATGRGPAARHEVVVPRADTALRLDPGNREIPLSVVSWLPSDAARWSGKFQWELRVGDRVLDVAEGPMSTLFSTNDDGLARFVLDGLPAAGDEVRYDGVLRSSSGHPICAGSVEVRALERLPAPEVTASLGAVTVVAPQGGEPKTADVNVARAGGTTLVEAVTLPHRITLVPGERVDIAWRRALDGDPMPWSPTADIEALARPPVPSDPGASVVDSMVDLAWAPVELPDTQYIVRVAAPEGPTLYVGPYAHFRDISGSGAKAYTIASLRNGLESELATVAAPAGAPSGTSSALIRLDPARRVRGLLPSSDRLAQCVKVGRRAVAEVQGPARPRIVAVIEGTSESALDRIVGELHGKDWLLTDGLVALAVISTRRGLVPWRGGRRLVRILEAPLEFQRPDWRMVATSVEPAEGKIVGVTESDGKDLVLTPLDGTLNLSDTDALLVYKRNGTSSRRLLRAGGLAPVINGDLRLTGMEALLVAAAGLGLDMASPSVLVAATHSPARSTFGELLWQDVARGFPLFVAQRLESEWRSPVASVYPGNPLVLNYLQGAEPVELGIRCAVVNARGKATLSMSIADVVGRSAKEFRVNLAAPASYRRVVDTALAWVREVNRGRQESQPELISLI